MRQLLWIGIAALGLAGCHGCGNREKEAPTPLASADPEGKDLVPGTIVAAVEKQGGVRLYKVVEVNWFPAPIGEELVLIAFDEKAAGFEQARDLWNRGGLTVALPNVRVARHMFIRRDHRTVGTEPVTDEDKNAKPGDPHRKSGS